MAENLVTKEIRAPKEALKSNETKSQVDWKSALIGAGAAVGGLLAADVLFDPNYDIDGFGSNERHGLVDDSDFDTIPDIVEIDLGLDPFKSDTDGDGKSDASEVTQTVISSGGKEGFVWENKDENNNGTADGNEPIVIK